MKIQHPRDLALYIDHTCLKAETQSKTIIQMCQEALEYRFAAICVPPCFIKLSSRELRGSSVKPITVIGFPLGYNTTKIKVLETEQALNDGALEVDMVIAIGALKNRQFKEVEQDIRSVVNAAGDQLVKVIIETALISEEEKKIACQISHDAGAGFVKTSTGFSNSGATIEDIQLMRKTVGPQMGVKASGGIKTYAQALAMIEAGANRIGTSSSVSIVT